MRRGLAAMLAGAVFVGTAQTAMASTTRPPALVARHAEPPASGQRPMPPDSHHQWDGKTGLPKSKIDPRLRQIVVDNAELDQDPEVREAARIALTGGDDAIMAFLNGGADVARAKANARRKEQADRDRAAIEALQGKGGPYLRAEVERVLAGSDADRADFLAFGKAIAEARDRQAAQDAKTRSDTLRSRVQMLAAVGGPEVQKAAKAALAAGDDAILQFLNTGYLVAAKADAKAREDEIKAQEERDKAARALSDLARRAARASKARQELVTAHGDGVRALQNAANALISASAESREAARILAADTAGGKHPADAFDQVKAEVARQLGYANQAARDAKVAAARADVQAKILVEVGLPYGTQWAQMAQGLADAAEAADKASETASHTVDATVLTDQARNAQEQAERHAQEAKRWREHAQEHAHAAAALAEAARVQAKAAADAAARTKAARAAAEQAEAQAWAAAARTRSARETAEREARNAAAARAVAERERAHAASARAEAEQQAAAAHAARGDADVQAGRAAGARARAEEQERASAQAEANARADEGAAAGARDRARAAEQALQVAQARAAAMEAMAAAARGGQHSNEAQAAASAAHADADTASGAARAAEADADAATGHAAAARSAATEATEAAARARAAAEQAAAAAARANAAANKAEAEAAATHAAALRSNAAAADATANEAKAAQAARTASSLARQATEESTEAAESAQRTKQEADEAATEAVSAATQAIMAVRASDAARASAAAVTDPANSAINVAAPFSGADVDMDFAILVANQAKAVGDEQAKAAQDRANEALEAAKQAQDAANRAAGEVKPAFDAAAAAAASAAAAARSAAEAQQAAARAAKDGAAARAAGARANQADAQAHADAIRARNAANAASDDAAIAGRDASAADHDATAARSAASAAEHDAAAARGAAANAQRDADAANTAAANAQKNADAATEAAKNALNDAVEAGKAADRAEEAARKAAEAQRAKDAANAGADVHNMSVKDLELLFMMGGADAVANYRDSFEKAKQGIIDYIIKNGGQILLDVIGVTDAKKCFGEANVAACLWTVLNAASLVVLVAKLPKLAAAVARVTAGLAKFLESSRAGRRILEIAEKLLEDGKLVWCAPHTVGAATSVSVAGRQGGNFLVRSVGRDQLASNGPESRQRSFALAGVIRRKFEADAWIRTVNEPSQLLTPAAEECDILVAGGPRVRAGRDIVVDAEGFVHPPTPAELAEKRVQGLSTFDTVEGMRGNVSGQVRRPKLPLPDGLGIIADDAAAGGELPKGHRTIYPTRRMSFEEFSSLIKSMQWENIGVKL